jgi:hypothetical protein
MKKPILRSDLVFTRSAEGNRKKTTIAVVEYKRRQVIRYKDYAKAILPSESSEQDIEKLKLKANETGMKGLATMLEGNAKAHGKQLCA